MRRVTTFLREVAVLIAASVVGELLAGVSQNWLYDRLSAWGLGPDHPPLRRGLVTALVLGLAGLFWGRRALRERVPPEAQKGPPIPVPRAQRNRQAMLERVHHAWIEGVLNQSLYHEARIALNLEEKPEAVDRPSAVERPWELLLRERDQEPHALEPTTRIVEVYDRMDGTLLILGAPGTVKPTANDRRPPMCPLANQACQVCDATHLHH